MSSPKTQPAPALLRFSHWGYAAVLLAVIAALVAVEAEHILYPRTFGDAGDRLHHAGQLTGFGRPWLPFLQLQIHLLYHLGAPLVAYALLPLFYAIVGLWAICRIGELLFPKETSGVLITVAVSLFVALGTFRYLNVMLFQEALCFGIFSLAVLCYYVRGVGWTFIFCFVLGVVTREIFWIYLAVSILFLLLRDRRLTTQTLILATVAILPMIWLLFTGQPPTLITYHQFAGSWSQYIWESGASIKSAFVQRQLHVTALFLIVAAVLLRYSKASKASETDTDSDRAAFCTAFHRFSLLSLALLYGYILIKAPWQLTPGNPRIAYTFFLHVPIWTLALWYQAQQRSVMVRRLVQVALLVAVLFPVSTMNRSLNFPQEPEVHRKIRHCMETLAQKRHPNVSLRVQTKEIDYWHALKDLLPPLLHHKRYFRTTPPHPADVIIAPRDSSVSSSVGNYEKRCDVDQYSVYERNTANAATKGE